MTLSTIDDRVEVPAGAQPVVRAPDDPIIDGLPPDWPALLGYNRVSLKANAERVVSVADDPLVVAGSFGKGRSAAFTSDYGPHWCPPPFVAWEGYAAMWDNLVRWVASR